jgi:molybdate transport system substrate-binding protein
VKSVGYWRISAIEDSTGDALPGVAQVYNPPPEEEKCMKRTIVAALASFTIAASTWAAEISVLSGGAIEPGLTSAAHAFERQTGHQVKLTFNTAPQIAKRVAAGDHFDVVISPPAAIEEFAKAGKAGSADRMNVGKVGLGVAVRPGAPAPDVSSVDTLKRAIVEADSLTFNRASTGIYFENLLKKWGIYDEVEKKTTRYPDGAAVMEHALKGKGNEIAFGAITEILLYKEKGLRYVGPLPTEVQNYTTYIATPMSGGSQPELARQFVQFLGSPAGKKLFVAAGIE